MTNSDLERELLRYLTEDEATAHWLARNMGLTREHVSARLQALRRRGLVVFDRVSWRIKGRRKAQVVKRV
jgi:predicted ArsR family transcriptional regulator